MPHFKPASAAALFFCAVFASKDRIPHARDGSIATPWIWSNSSGSAATGSSTSALSSNAIVSPTPPPTPSETAVVGPPFNQVSSSQVVRGNRSCHGVIGIVSQSRAAAENASISSPCTINIRGATIESWYTSEFIWPTYSFASQVVDSTLTYVVFTADDFNVTTALSWALGQAVVTTSWDAIMSTSLIEFIPTILPGPVAATTAVLTVDKFAPLPTGPLTEPNLVESLALNIFTPRSATITGPSNTEYVAPSGIPFVHFTEYQVERSEPVTDALGNCYYTHLTTTRNFSSPLAFDYSGDSLEGLSSITGNVPSDFVAQIPESTCVPGAYTGSVTVLIVVNIIYTLVGNANMIHIESSVGQIGLPTQHSKAYVENSASIEAPQPLPSATASANHDLTGNDITAIVSRIQNWALNIVHFESSVQNLDPPTIMLAGTEVSNTEADPTHAPSANDGDGVPQNGYSGAQNGAQPGQIAPGSDFSPPVVVIGGNSFTMGSSSAFVIGQKTLVPGGFAIAVGGTTVYPAPSATAVVVNGVSLLLGGLTQAFPSTMITAAPANPVVIGGQTLVPGGNVDLGGTTISLDSMGLNLVINGYSKALSGAASANQPLITVAGSNYAAADGTSFVIAGQTLIPGGSITVGGTILSLDASDKSIYINGVASSLSNGYPFSTLYPAITLQGTPITPQVVSAGAQPTYIIGSATLTPGGRVIVSGTALSLATYVTALLINGATSNLNPAILTSLPAIPFGSTSLSPILGPGRSYIIGDQTLLPGGRITVSGTTLSLLPTPTAVVIDSATYALSQPASNRATTNAPLITLGGHTYTALSRSVGGQPTYVIGSQILTAGGSIVLPGGTTVSLAPHATAIVVNGVTTVLFPATTTAARSSRLAELTIGAATYTALAAGGAAGPTFVINGVTLTPGGTIVLGPGTTVVLQSASGGAAVAVVAGVTTATVAGPVETWPGSSARVTAAEAEGPKETSKGKGKENAAAIVGMGGTWITVIRLWGFMGVVFWMF